VQSVVLLHDSCDVVAVAFQNKACWWLDILGITINASASLCSGSTNVLAFGEGWGAMRGSLDIVVVVGVIIIR